jgi:hypothetical protein
MTEPIPPEDHQSMVDPTFTVVRRGFDQSEVRRALIGLAGDLRAARERELLLTRQLAEAERRAEAVDPLDPSHLTKLLGDEVARILDAARAAAVQIRVRADEAATRLFEETKAEAAADAAELLERARIEAREVLRLAQERSGEALGYDDGSSEVRDVPTPPTPPTQQRSGRSGVDASRTAGLFASLREQEAAAPAQRTVRSRKVTKSTKPTNATKATKQSAPTATTAPIRVEPVAAAVPSPAVPSSTGQSPAVPSLPGPSSPASSLDAMVSAVLSRAIKRTLTDDLNALLAEIPGRRARGRAVPVSLDPEVGPTVARYAEGLMAALTGLERPVDDQMASDIAGKLAQAIVLPLRSQIDELLSGSADDPDLVQTELRRCFRQCRGELVDPSVQSVLASLQL